MRWRSRSAKRSSTDDADAEPRRELDRTGPRGRAGRAAPHRAVPARRPGAVARRCRADARRRRATSCCAGATDQAREVLEKALARTRMTIGELRDLSFNLEPVVLRDHGFAMAVSALARGPRHRARDPGRARRRGGRDARRARRRRRCTRSCARRSRGRSAAARRRRSRSRSAAGERQTLEVTIRDDAPASAGGGRSRCSRSARARSARRSTWSRTTTARRCGSSCRSYAVSE